MRYYDSVITSLKYSREMLIDELMEWMKEQEEKQ